MGQAAVIKINSQDFSTLRQGHTLPRMEREEKEKAERSGIAWMGRIKKGIIKKRWGVILC